MNGVISCPWTTLTYPGRGTEKGEGYIHIQPSALYSRHPAHTAVALRLCWCLQSSHSTKHPTMSILWAQQVSWSKHCMRRCSSSFSSPIKPQPAASLLPQTLPTHCRHPEPPIQAPGSPPCAEGCSAPTTKPGIEGLTWPCSHHQRLSLLRAELHLSWQQSWLQLSAPGGICTWTLPTPKEKRPSSCFPRKRWLSQLLTFISSFSNWDFFVWVPDYLM